jgi:hypothetical protein
MKHSLIRPNLMLGLLLAATATASAHPGHHPLGGGVGHVFASGYHLTLLALTGAALVALGFVAHRTAVRRGLQCIGAVLLAVAVAWRFAA